VAGIALIIGAIATLVTALGTVVTGYLKAKTEADEREDQDEDVLLRWYKRDNERLRRELSRLREAGNDEWSEGSP